MNIIKKWYSNIFLIPSFFCLFFCIGECNPKVKPFHPEETLIILKETVDTGATIESKTEVFTGTSTPWPPYTPLRLLENGSGDKFSLYVIDFSELGDREDGIYEESRIVKYNSVFEVVDEYNFIISFKGENDEEPFSLRIYTPKITWEEFEKISGNPLLILPKTESRKIIAVQVHFSIHNYMGDANTNNYPPNESYFFTDLSCNGYSAEIRHGRFGDYYYDSRNKSEYEKLQNMRVQMKYPKLWENPRYFVARYSFKPNHNSDYQEGNVYIELVYSNESIDDIDILSKIPEDNTMCPDREIKKDVIRCRLDYDNPTYGPVKFGVRKVRHGSLDVRIYKIIFWLEDN